jgi:hypothetical protein
MYLFKGIQQCLTGEADDAVNINKKPSTDVKIPIQTSEEATASSILSALFTAEKAGRDLERRVQDLVRSCGWYEGLAKRILDGLVASLNSGAAMGGAMKEAFDKAFAIGSDFVHEHPTLTAAMATVVAIGILVILAPWAVEALGFGELGPVEG